ncbi:MAG: ABC transporter ATP-binding protein/permease [Actinomycetales bacterium]|nr:ABC transporter ATP-binding protein/permease [Actinomycetales bacterium]
MPIIAALKRALELLEPRDHRRLYIAMAAQICVSLLDTAGVLMVGAITFIASSTSQGHGIPESLKSVLESLGYGNIPANTVLGVLGAITIILFISRSIIAPILLRRILRFLTGRSAEISGELSRKFFRQSLKEVNWATSQRTAFALGSGISATISDTLGAWVILVAEASLLLMLSITLLVIAPGITLFTLFYFAIVMYFMQKWLGKKSSRAAQQRYAADIAGASAVIELVNSFREVFVGNHTEYYVEKFSHIRKSGAAAQSTLQLINYIPKYALEAALISGAGLLTVFEFSTQNPSKAISTLVLFMSAGSRMFPSLIRIQGSTTLIRAASSAARYTTDLITIMRERNMLQAQSENLESKSKSELDQSFYPAIEISDVKFKYGADSDYIVNGITAHIEPGSFVAIVGPTGSGKSTLVDLILGVSEPESGSIRIGGRQPREAVNVWPGRIGFVPQSVALNATSVRENVAIGLKRDEIDDLKVWEVLERVRLANTLRESREGLDTEVGERGIRFSGGQRQRLGLARALYSDPKLLVLDEATSALDSETELAVSQAIENLGSQVTRITIAHRLATVMHADTVLYLDGGRIVASGTFAQVRNQVPEFDQQAKLLGL